jgi:hypothetical protein
MAAVPLSWSILSSRGNSSLATKTQEPGLLARLPTWAQVLTLLGAAIAGAYGMYQLTVRDLPELRASLVDIQKQLVGISEAQKATRSDVATYQNTITRMDAKIFNVQTELAALIQRVEKRALKGEDYRRIFSEVQSVTKAEATLLNAPTVTGAPPSAPPTIIAAAEQYKPEVAKLLSSDWKQMGSTENIFARMLLTPNVKWEVGQNSISARYEGGRAVFPIKGRVSIDDLQSQAEIYNSLSSSLNMVLLGGTIVPYKPPRIVEGQKFQIPPKAPAPDAPGRFEYKGSIK